IHRDLHSFPTRRSSDLDRVVNTVLAGRVLLLGCLEQRREKSFFALERQCDHGIAMNEFGNGLFALVWRNVAGNKQNLAQLAALRSEEHTSELQSRGHLV